MTPKRPPMSYHSLYNDYKITTQPCGRSPSGFVVAKQFSAIAAKQFNRELSAYRLLRIGLPEVAPMLVGADVNTRTLEIEWIAGEEEESWTSLTKSQVGTIGRTAASFHKRFERPMTQGTYIKLRTSSEDLFMRAPTRLGLRKRVTKDLADLFGGDGHRLLEASAITLVHRDYTLRNMLWIGERQVKVIDWERCTTHIADLDLARLLCYAPIDVRRQLFDGYREVTDSPIESEARMRLFGLVFRLSMLAFVATTPREDGRNASLAEALRSQLDELGVGAGLVPLALGS